jgi:hypothetical protein
MDTFYGILEEFLPLVGRYISGTLSSPTKNAIQVASKILRSLLHMHGPNTPNPQKKNLLENFFNY